jgi:hypothetical protein
MRTMSRTHHATRTWRLSCGCLRDYPGMPLGKVHSVLCVACRLAVITLYAYPDQRCGLTTTAPRQDGGLSHVSCTHDEGHEGSHYDRYVEIRFEARGKLRAAREGQT